MSCQATGLICTITSEKKICQFKIRSLLINNRSENEINRWKREQLMQTDWLKSRLATWSIHFHLNSLAFFCIRLVNINNTINSDCTYCLQKWIEKILNFIQRTEESIMHISNYRRNKSVCHLFDQNSGSVTLWHREECTPQIDLRMTTFGISHRIELNCFSLPPSLRESVPFNFCIRFVFRFHDQITSNLIFWNVWTFRSIARVHSLEYICIGKCGGDARYTKAKIHAITIGCVCGWFP